MKFKPATNVCGPGFGVTRLTWPGHPSGSRSDIVARTIWPAGTVPFFFWLRAVIVCSAKAFLPLASASLRLKLMDEDRLREAVDGRIVLEGSNV